MTNFLWVAPIEEKFCDITQVKCSQITLFVNKLGRYSTKTIYFIKNSRLTDRSVTPLATKLKQVLTNTNFVL